MRMSGLAQCASPAFSSRFAEDVMSFPTPIGRLPVWRVAAGLTINTAGLLLLFDAIHATTIWQ